MRLDATSSAAKLAVVTVVAIVIAVVVGIVGSPLYGVLVGWDVAAAAFVAWNWISMWPQDSSATARLAVREDPGRALTDILLLVACVVSLGAVGLVLLSDNSHGT